jgi:hypothetical protein
MPGEGAFMKNSRLGCVEDFAGLGNARQHALRELRELDELLAVGPLRHAAKAVHALRDIGLKPDPALLAVVGAVDPGFGLSLEHVRDTRVGELGEFCAIDRLALFLVDQHGAQRFAARNTAGVRRQDAIAAVLHGFSPDRLR